MHRYACAECGEEFQTETFADKCPKCRCKVLVHLDGERKRAKGCSGNCSSGCSCGHCH